MRPKHWLLCAVCVSHAFAAVDAQAQWLQWGGPDRNFKTQCDKLADAWPESGPPIVWSRELGDGFSSILVDSGTMYTMCRRPDAECVVALNAKTGETRWEYQYDAPLLEDMRMEWGPGPHATPLIVNDRIFTVGVTAKFHCLDKKSGKVIWSHDMFEEFGTPHLGRGYGASPIAYKHTVILQVGAEGQAIMAFDQKDGSVVWGAQDFQISYASPILINLDGQDQFVVFTGKEVAGLNPASGELIWSHPHQTRFDANIATPCWDGKDVIFCSSAYGGGSRALRLKRDGAGTTVEELWYDRRFQVHHGNVVCVDGNIYGSSGSFGPALFMAVELESGKLLWRERGFAKATSVYGDGKVFFLDQDGQLVMARVSSEGMEVLSKCELLKRVAWTVPTLVGDRLYVRDRKTIVVLDLSS